MAILLDRHMIAIPDFFFFKEKKKNACINGISVSFHLVEYQENNDKMNEEDMEIEGNVDKW